MLNALLNGSIPLAQLMWSLENTWIWMKQTGWSKLSKLGLVLITGVVILWAVQLVAKAIRKAVDDGNSEVTTDAERRAETLASVLTNSARVLVAVVVILMILQEFGVNIQPLLAGSAVAGVALGFGAQTLVKDVIAGFFLLLENQFAVGDIITVDDRHSGTVERMTLRMTLLRDAEGYAHFLPNGTINKVVVMSKDYARAIINVEVGLAEDMDRIISVLKEFGEQLQKDMPDKVTEATEVKGIEAFGSGICTIRTSTKTAPGAQWDVAREFRKRVILGFRERGIDLAIPQRVVLNRNLADLAPGQILPAE